MQVDPDSENGGRQVVHSVAEAPQEPQGAVQGLQVDPSRKYPSLHTLQTLALHSKHPGEHLLQSVPFSFRWKPLRHSAHIVKVAAT